MRLFRSALVSAIAAGALVVGFAMPASAETVDVSGTASGTVFPGFGGTGTPLLDQFEFRYSNSDHHLKTLASRPRVSDIEIAFADVNGDDEYTFRSVYQRVSPAGISTGSMHNECGGGACTRSINRPPGDVVFVITGFKFRFDSDDHHIDSIGILENSGQLTTYFDDQNNDDDYTVDVDFAWVPRARLGTLGEATASVHAAGSGSSTTVGGNKIIRGFRVDNLADSGGGRDNHIKSFGIRTNSTSITVLYGDKDPADSADWSYRVRFAVLI